MMKYLTIISMVVFPTVASAQLANSWNQPYHSLSGSDMTNIPKYSWENPGWNEGATKGWNASSPAGNGGAGGVGGGTTLLKGIEEYQD